MLQARCRIKLPMAIPDTMLCQHSHDRMLPCMLLVVQWWVLEQCMRSIACMAMPMATRFSDGAECTISGTPTIAL